MRDDSYSRRRPSYYDDDSSRRYSYDDYDYDRDRHYRPRREKSSTSHRSSHRSSDRSSDKASDKSSKATKITTTSLLMVAAIAGAIYAMPAHPNYQHGHKEEHHSSSWRKPRSPKPPVEEVQDFEEEALKSRPEPDLEPDLERGRSTERMRQH